MIPSHSKQSELSPVSAVFHDFVQNTSLLGIQQFLRNKSFIWLLAYLACVTMSIIQSWSVTVKFFEQNTFQSITVASKTLVPFPSVTVCTGTLLREDFNFSSIPGFDVHAYKRILQKCEDAIVMRKMAKRLQTNNMAVGHYMRSLSEERRLELGLNLSHVVKECRLGALHCNVRNHDDFHIYNNPFYGNCFTFNPAYNEKSAKLLNQGDGLRMTFRFPSGGYWLTRRAQPKLAVYIHPPGTAPIIEDPEVLDVFADEVVTIAVTLQSEMISVKKLLTKIPSCVDSEDEAYRQKSMYYTSKSPYMYSQEVTKNGDRMRTAHEACLASCTQVHYGKCGAIRAYSPVQSKDYERGKIINFHPECDMGPVNMEACDCPIPCKKLVYTFIKDYNDIYNIPCKRNPAPVPSPTPSFEIDDDVPDNADYEENEARIHVHFRTNIYEKIEELLSCGLSEYLGILGGNVGLWIGLCIISILEVIELIIKLITAAMATRRKQQTQLNCARFMRQPRPQLPRPIKRLHF